jgi:hypothetical protein
MVPHKLNVSTSDISQGQELCLAKAFMYLGEPEEIFRHFARNQLSWMTRYIKVMYVVSGMMVGWTHKHEKPRWVRQMCCDWLALDPRIILSLER